MSKDHYHTKHLANLVRGSKRFDTATILDLCDGVDRLIEYANRLEEIREELEAKLKGTS